GELSQVATRRHESAPELIGLLRGDLDWIVMKCLEKDRSRRYESADGLAADIQRFLRQEPVQARPPSVSYRLGKLVRRNRLAVAATGAVVIAIVAGLVFSAWAYRQKSKAYEEVVKSEREQERLRLEAEKARAGETMQRQAAEQARENEASLRREAQARAYAADMSLAQRSIELNNFGRARDLLNRYRPSPGQPDRRGWEWRYLWQFCRSDALFTFREQGDWIHQLALSADGKWLVIDEPSKGEMILWDARTRAEVARFPCGDGVTATSFSPRAPLLAAGVGVQTTNGYKYSVRLWNAESRQMTRELSLDAYCLAIRFSEDGTEFITADQAAIRRWRVADGAELSSVKLPPLNRPNAAAFTSDFGTVALGARDMLVVLDARTGQLVNSAPLTDIYFTCLAFSPDNKFLVSAQGTIETWVTVREVSPWREVARLEGHQAYVLGASFSPDGKSLATASADQTARIWSTGDWKLKGVLRGHRLEVWGVGWMPDNSTLISGSKDGGLLAWDATKPRRANPNLVVPAAVNGGWGFHPSNGSVIAASRSGRVSEWSGPTFEEEHRL
ncbi:MAG TPA: hypothetical protein VHH73_11205, partial [Verrucomicrobiae bacterium]|nr:hypothetical protein [Verrucomicrobiae bacterium]